MGLQTVGGARHVGQALSRFCRASSAGVWCNQFDKTLIKVVINWCRPALLPLTASGAEPVYQPLNWSAFRNNCTGYGRKFSGARGQPLTRGPEADETKTMTVTLPHHARVSLSKQRQHRSARSTCAAAPNVRSSPLGADTVCKSGNSFADALFTQGLMALMQPSICCVRAQSAREFVTEFSGGATPHRSGMAQS